VPQSDRSLRSPVLPQHLQPKQGKARHANQQLHPFTYKHIRVRNLIIAGKYLQLCDNYGFPNTPGRERERTSLAVLLANFVFDESLPRHAVEEEEGLALLWPPHQTALFGRRAERRGCNSPMTSPQP